MGDRVRGADAAAKEILCLNEALPVVSVEDIGGGRVRVSTLGDAAVCLADISLRPEEWEDEEEFFKQFAEVSAQLQADQNAPIPDVPMRGARVWIESRLRPNAAPCFNGDCRIVWLWEELPKGG